MRRCTYILYLCNTQKVSFPLRFVDRDMVMRYHWGLGIGHVYAHVQSPIEDGESDSDQPVSEEQLELAQAEPVTRVTTNNSSAALGDDTEMFDVEPGCEGLEDELDDNSNDGCRSSGLDDDSVWSDDVDDSASDYYTF